MRVIVRLTSTARFAQQWNIIIQISYLIVKPFEKLKYFGYDRVNARNYALQMTINLENTGKCRDKTEKYSNQDYLTISSTYFKQCTIIIC